MKKIFTLFFLVLSLAAFSEEKYLARTVIVKVKPQFRSYCSETKVEYPGMTQFLEQIKTQSFAKIYPHHAPMPKKYSRGGILFTDLSLVYKLQYNEDIDLGKVISGLLAMGIFEYAEPSYIFTPLGIPNDPSISSQWHLPMIKVYEAWDITQGDSNIVVGIIDTGIDFNHADLSPNIKFNYNDPIDGSDNDNDGYIDNFKGWDLAYDDNDPSHEAGGVTPQHGTWSSSSVAEVVNNNYQGAGVGYNTRVLPIKAANAAGSIVAGYEGIVYAADHGCGIINASWGTAGSWSQYGQDVINYATINKDALVVAAAGNSNNEGVFYPASFDYVLSVSGSDTLDHKWIFDSNNGSNYNEYVDLLAPSMFIYGTQAGGSFIKIGGGTSFAAPMVAAAGALLKKIHPEYSAIQLGEVLKNTTDVIDTIPFNATYTGKLGSGRLNVYRALTVTGIPGFVATNYQITDNADNLYIVGDTIRLKGIITNFLDPSSNAVATVSSTSPYLTFINNTLNLGAVANMGTVNFNSNPFTFKVAAGVPQNTKVIVVLTFTDGSYKETQAFTILLNPNYLNMDVNSITLSVGADAKLGYMASLQQSGSGFRYKSSDTYIYEMGLMVSDASANVSFAIDGDFTAVNALQVIQPGLEADKDINGLANDDGAAGNKLGIEIQHKTLGWSDTGLNDFIIEEYKIKNTSGDTLNNVYAGLYIDWDMITYQTDVALFDTTNKIGYAYEYNSTSGFAGTKALTNKNKVTHYAFDNSGANGSINIYDGFTDVEKKTALTNGDSRSIAGIGDIADLVGQGPFTILAGDSITIAFALLAGNSFNDLVTSGNKADSIYTTIRSITTNNSITNINCKGGCNGAVSLSPIYGVPPFSYQWNSAGNPTTASLNGICAGNYICTVHDAVNNVAQINVDILEPDSLLQLTKLDSNAVNGSCNGSASVLAIGGVKPYSYLWDDASNQTTSAASNLCQGNYNAIVTDFNGCMDTVNIIIENVTATSELSGLEMQVYPNPASNQTTVKISGEFKGVVNLLLCDISGRTIQSQKNIANINGSAYTTIDLGSIEAGVYILRIDNEGVFRDIKLSVSR